MPKGAIISAIVRLPAVADARATSSRICLITVTGTGLTRLGGGPGHP
jgi:hypothetical protein